MFSLKKWKKCEISHFWTKPPSPPPKKCETWEIFFRTSTETCFGENFEFLWISSKIKRLFAGMTKEKTWSKDSYILTFFWYFTMFTHLLIEFSWNNFVMTKAWFSKILWFSSLLEDNLPDTRYVTEKGLMIENDFRMFDRQILIFNNYETLGISKFSHLSQE